MRQRRNLLPMSSSQADSNETINPSAINITEVTSKDKNSLQIPIYIAFLGLALCCLLYGGVYLLANKLPAPYLSKHEADYPDKFIAEHAQTTLKGLAVLGPKVVGSVANEQHAPTYLHGIINEIISTADPSFNISRDHQIATGSYYLGFEPFGLINSYANVQNLIVKIHGSSNEERNESILINAHYDSVPTSPGASDDGIMVAVMLETLRKLTRKPAQYKHDIIFLFNGAEETPLQAAHAFITQHPWAKTCAVIVNLEAAGHGGKAIMFQTGPKQSKELLEHYLSAPHPYGQAAGEEIFQSNLIPSDTDFRVFRDFGGLSGFDIAFARNGYRYHTKYDSFEDLPLGSYQHAGDNLLALLKSLGSADKIFERLDDAKMIYFDVFSWFMINYSMTVAYILNILTAIGSVIIAFFSIQLGKHDICYIVITTSVIFASWLLAGAVAIIIALFIDYTQNTMTWYGYPLVIFGLYVAPTLATIAGVMFFYNRFGRHKGRSLAQQSQLQMHIVRLWWSFVLFIGTILKIRSVYVIMIGVLSNTIACAIICLCKWRFTARKWQICVLLFTVPPVMMNMYFSDAIFALFIPITGRIGANRNPEIIVAMLTMLIILLIATHYIHFLVLIKKQYWIPIVLYASFALTVFVILGKLVFPYNGDQISPTPQRFLIYHTNRVHYDDNNVQQEEKSGIFMLNLDRNSPESIKNNINLGNYNISSDCSKYLACGMPISSSRMLAIVEASTWIPFEKPVISEKTSMLYNVETISDEVRRYNFSIEGPDHLTIFIEPQNKAEILSTSLYPMETDGMLFINHVYGQTKTTLNFQVDVRIRNPEEKPLKFVVSGKYYHFDEHETLTPDFLDFIRRFPSWADVVPAIANYESYVL